MDFDVIAKNNLMYINDKAGRLGEKNSKKNVLSYAIPLYERASRCNKLDVQQAYWKLLYLIACHKHHHKM